MQPLLASGGATAAVQLQPVNAGVYAVLTASGAHVGNLKRVAGQWKFKAVGYTPGGEVVPGGGPLTDRHNTVFEHPAPQAVAQGLGLG